MSTSVSRRRFLKQSALVGGGVGMWLAGRTASARRPSPNYKLNLGIIGVGNRGADTLPFFRSENIVALCDVDEGYLAAAAQAHPQAARYTDYRRLLDRRDLDAVVISIPEHSHAPATMRALEAGLHVYCEKPLTHTVEEARTIAKEARRRRRVTQLGTQRHEGSNFRRCVELIQSGAIGEVREVHVWVRYATAPFIPSTDTPPVPDNLDWNTWLGPAVARAYNPDYVPQRWRRFWDFGNGVLGDFGCHYLDLPFWALQLGPAATVAAEGPPVNPQTTPEWLIVRYQFPERGTLPPVNLTWYHGGRRPEAYPEANQNTWRDGILFVGSQGRLLADYERRVLLPEVQYAGYVPPPPTIPDSIGHYTEWIEACKGRGTTLCNFTYGGLLTETALLGNVAYRVGQPITWDARRLRAVGLPEASAFLRGSYRRGWRL